jgi:thiol-disulfide isomerase/thioredoxin
MKKIVILIFSIFMLYACKKQETNDYLVFSGKIKNFDKGKIKLENSINFSTTADISIDKDGYFSDTLQIKTGHYSFRIGDKMCHIYLAKNSNLDILLDANNLAKITYKGTYANENRYLLKKENEYETKTRSESEALFILPEKDFLLEINKIKKLKVKLANNYNLKGSFLTQELRDIEYNHLIRLIDYKEGVHAALLEDDSFKVSDSFPSTEESIFDYNDEENFNNSIVYRHLFFKYLKQEESAAIRDGKNNYFSYPIHFINTKISNATIKNYFLYTYTKHSINNSPDRKKTYTTFMDYSSNEEDKLKITELYNELKIIDKGSLSPKFINYKNFKGGVSSLDDFKGSYVYIDIWATWCGPCEAEIPFLEKIEKKYHGRNIKFVSISVDRQKDYEKWKKMIVDKKMGGIQLFADGDFKSDFIKSYKIKSIPRFILINPIGKIISSSTLRPSNPKLIELLNGLNI